MQPISIVGDSTSPTPGLPPAASTAHVLTALNAFPTVTAYGVAVCVANLYKDPTHNHLNSDGNNVPTPFTIVGAGTVTVGGFPVHRLGDPWDCGDITDIPINPVPTVFVGL